LSYAFDLAADGLIVLVVPGVFLVTWYFAPKHGLVAKIRARRAQLV
jgi:manganese/iron transport system permease protein